MRPTPRIAALLYAFAVLVLTALVYAPGLGGGFLFDDFPNIVTNSRIHAEVLDWASLETATRAYVPGFFGRPLAMVGFTIDYLVGGKDPWGYKLHSVIVHLVNALLVFWLVLRLLSLPRAGSEANAGWRILAAFAISLLWAIHPLQISTVLYIVQRMEMLSLTFVLLALIAYLRGRSAQRQGTTGWPWLVLSGVLAVIGMLSKETAALFPVYALALELTVLEFDAREQKTRKFLKCAYAGAFLAALAVFLLLILPSHLEPATYDLRDFTLYERLLSQMRVLPMYIGQVLLPLPSRLLFYYDTFPKSTGWLSPATTLAGGLFLLVLLAAAWRLRRRMPLVALGIAWFLGAHLITSNVFALELVFEHRNYFALLGILLALADLVCRLPLRDGRGLKIAVVGALVLGYAFLAVLRAATWGSPLHLAAELVANNPQSPRASSDLATLYVGMSGGDANSPFYSFGKHEFERGSRLPNASPLTEQGLILMAATTGQSVPAEWWDQLIHKVKTRPIGPQEEMAVTGLLRQRYAGVMLDDDRLSEAYEALIARSPLPRLHVQYGDYVVTFRNDEALAVRMYIAAIDGDPTDAVNAAKIVSTLIANGHVRVAQAVFERAHELGLMVMPANGANGRDGTAPRQPASARPAAPATTQAAASPHSS